MSAGLASKGVKLRVVFRFAGTVMAVELADTEAGVTVRDDVAVGPAEELGATIVKRIVTVYVFPLAADVIVKTTGTISPAKLTGGSKSTWLPGAMVAKVALLDVTVSAGLARYGERLKTVFTPAGMVRAVAVDDADADERVGAEDVARTEELNATTVTSIITVYVLPPEADTTVNTTGTVSPIRALGGSSVTWVPAMVANVALLVVMVSAGLTRYGLRSTTVPTLAGIVIDVEVSGDAELVGGAVTLTDVDGATTVTSMVTV